MMPVSDNTEISAVPPTPAQPTLTLHDALPIWISVSVLNPAKTLPRTSEGTTLSSGNFPAPLLIESAIAATRLSDVLRLPVKALDTLSETADTELLEMARAPVKALQTMSDATRLSSANFKA